MTGFALNQQQLATLQALQNAGGAGAYDYLAELAAGGLQNGYDQSLDQTRLWLEGASQANSGQGLFSTIIRTYTKAQAMIRGVDIDDDLMQLASDRVREEVVKRVLEGGTLPTIDQIAAYDANAIRDVLFPHLEANGAWSGAILFQGLGSFQAWRLVADDTHIFNLPGDRVELLKLVMSGLVPNKLTDDLIDLSVAAQAALFTYRHVDAVFDNEDLNMWDSTDSFWRDYDMLSDMAENRHGGWGTAGFGNLVRHSESFWAEAEELFVKTYGEPTPWMIANFGSQFPMSAQAMLGRIGGLGAVESRDWLGRTSAQIAFDVAWTKLKEAGLSNDEVRERLGLSPGERPEPDRQNSVQDPSATRGGYDDPNCFVSGTPILLSDGTSAPIQELRVGTPVLTFAEDGSTKVRRVTHVFEHEGAEVIEIAGVRCTAAHRFLTSDGRFVAAGALHPQDKIVVADGSTRAAGHTRAVNGRYKVYNFTVEETHTHIAGGFRVHNYKPVVLDLDGDGVELVGLEESMAFFDTDGDGFKENLGWAAADDGLLAIDLDGDNKIELAAELNFTLHHEDAETDMEGLRLAFDSNNDGVLDAQDERFGDFRVWQDADGDGVSDEGEVKSLAEAGITSIGLDAERNDEEIDGNIVHRRTQMTRAGLTASLDRLLPGLGAPIRLDRQQMQIDGRPVDLTPGMAATVDIKTGSRRLIEYVLTPLQRYQDESLRER